MMLKKHISTILSLVWFLTMPGIGFADTFRDVSPLGGGYVAVSASGTIATIDAEGGITRTIDTGAPGRMNAIAVIDGRIIAAGEKGFVCSWADGTDKVTKMKTGSQVSVNTLEVFGGMLLAGCDDGTILSWSDCGKAPSRQKLELKGSIVDLSSDGTQCYGITELGEIISTRDGLNWTVFDFNGNYNGYYGNVKFKGICIGLGSIAATGIYTDSSRAAVFISSRGTVWSERDLSYTVGADTFGLNETPLSVHYDARRDSFILTCSDGILFHIPGCSHCNRPEFLNSSDLWSLAFNGDGMLVVGADNFIGRL